MLALPTAAHRPPACFLLSPLCPLRPSLLSPFVCRRSHQREAAGGSPITDLCPGETKELPDNEDIVPGLLCPGWGSEAVPHSDSPVSPHLAVHEPDDVRLMPQTYGEKLWWE